MDRKNYPPPERVSILDHDLDSDDSLPEPVVESEKILPPLGMITIHCHIQNQQHLQRDHAIGVALLKSIHLSEGNVVLMEICDKWMLMLPKRAFIESLY